MSLIGLPTVTLPDPATVSLTRTYDVLIVGSGAAGGMAAHVLTSAGLDVLLLEAGRQVDFEAEVRSLEWPYEHPRRGKRESAMRGELSCCVPEVLPHGPDQMQW